MKLRKMMRHRHVNNDFKYFKDMNLDNQEKILTKLQAVNDFSKVDKPYKIQLLDSDIDMVIGASYDSVAMVEGEMKEISEAEMVEAIKFAHEEIKKHCKVQLELSKEVGTETKREYNHENHDLDLADKVMEFCYDKFYEVAKKSLDKHARSEQFSAIKDEFKATLTEEELSEKSFMLNSYFKKAEKKEERLSKKVNRKFKRKQAKGKVDKDKMVKELKSRNSKEK